MYSEFDPMNNGRPSLCHKILDAVNEANDTSIRPFRIAYIDQSAFYVILAL